MTDASKRTPIFLPRPTFMSTAGSVSPAADSAFVEDDSLYATTPEIRGNNLRFTESGLLLLFSPNQKTFFRLFDQQIVKIETEISIRLPKNYVAHIAPHEYTYDSIRVLPRVINTIFNSDFTEIVLDLLLYNNTQSIQNIGSDKALAVLYITKICTPKIV